MALAHDAMDVANPTAESIILLRIKVPLTVDIDHLNYKTSNEKKIAKKFEAMKETL